MKADNDLLLLIGGVAAAGLIGYHLYTSQHAFQTTTHKKKKKKKVVHPTTTRHHRPVGDATVSQYLTGGAKHPVIHFGRGHIKPFGGHPPPPPQHVTTVHHPHHQGKNTVTGLITGGKSHHHHLDQRHIKAFDVAKKVVHRDTQALDRRLRRQPHEGAQITFDPGAQAHGETGKQPFEGAKLIVHPGEQVMDHHGKHIPKHGHGGSPLSHQNQHKAPKLHVGTEGGGGVGATVPETNIHQPALPGSTTPGGGMVPTTGRHHPSLRDTQHFQQRHGGGGDSTHPTGWINGKGIISANQFKENRHATISDGGSTIRTNFYKNYGGNIPFANYSFTSYAKLGKIQSKATDKKGIVMLTSGGPSETHDYHTCCNYTLGFTKNGDVFAEMEGDHKPRSHTPKMPVKCEGGGCVTNIGDLEDKDIGLRQNIWYTKDPSDGSTHVHLQGWVDAGDGKGWQKFYQATDPSPTSGQYAGKPILKAPMLSEGHEDDDYRGGRMRTNYTPDVKFYNQRIQEIVPMNAAATDTSTHSAPDSNEEGVDAETTGGPSTSGYAIEPFDWVAMGVTVGVPLAILLMLCFSNYL